MPLYHRYRRQHALLFCALTLTLALTASEISAQTAPIPITTSTAVNPAARTLNTALEYRIADSATLTFANGVSGTGTDGGVFSYTGNTAATARTLIIMPDSAAATDPTGISPGTGAVIFSNNSAGRGVATGQTRHKAPRATCARLRKEGKVTQRCRPDFFATRWK